MKRFIHISLILLTLLIPSLAVAQNGFIRSLCQVHYPSDQKIQWNCVKLKRGDSPHKLFGARWEDVLRFNRLDRRHFTAGRSIKVPKNLDSVKNFTPLPATYPDAAQEEKFILVDQSEMFLGAYEHGNLVLSFPAAVGVAGHRVPDGDFKVDGVDRMHESDTYMIEGTDTTYPMHYGLRFLVDNLNWISYWIHGRDVPGVPASHGCIGLYDEEMQSTYYHDPRTPILNDAKKLYEWVVGSHEDSGAFHRIGYGPKVRVIGTPPM